MRDYLSTQPGSKGDQILTGMSPRDLPNPGPVVCACFGIGVNTILDAITSQGLMSVEAVGEALGAGTNCGSCKPELGALLLGATAKEAAE